MDGEDIYDMDVDGIGDNSWALKEEGVHDVMEDTGLRTDQGGVDNGVGVGPRLLLGGLVLLEDLLHAFEQVPLVQAHGGGDLHGTCPNSRESVTLVLGEGLIMGGKRCRDGDDHTKDEFHVGSKKRCSSPSVGFVGEQP